MAAMREDRAPVKWNKKFVYPKSQRSLIQGKRHYDIKEKLLPSVTTIISATQSEEKRQSLANWKARLGDTAADRVRDIAAYEAQQCTRIWRRMSGEQGTGT